jgi:hypothetical protein
MKKPRTLSVSGFCVNHKAHKSLRKMNCSPEATLFGLRACSFLNKPGKKPGAKPGRNIGTKTAQDATQKTAQKIIALKAPG